MLYSSNYIFLHPTKTGGTSVASALKQYSGSKCHLPINGFTVNKKKSYKNALVFATCRNPYDRVLSMYNYFGFLKGTSFDDFLKMLKKNHLRNVPLYPQHLYVERGAFKVDELIRIESFEEDWKRVINGKLKITRSVIKENVTGNKRKIELLSSEKEIIYKIYEKDFKLLKYSK